MMSLSAGWVSLLLSACLFTPAPLVLSAAVTLPQCFGHYAVQNLYGQPFNTSDLLAGPLTLPDSCSALLCSRDPSQSAAVSPVLVYHQPVDSPHAYLSLSLDSHSVGARQCLEDSRASPLSYRRLRFPMTVLAAGAAHVVLHDSSCPAVRPDQRRLLLLALLRARSVQPLEVFILCDRQLQVTEPFTHVQHAADEAAKSSASANRLELTQSQLQPSKSWIVARDVGFDAAEDTSPNTALTHITLYSNHKARSTPSGFVPRYARFELARDLVVSVMSSCEGGRRQMEFINRLAATWLGAIDSCLRLLCHSTVEHLAVGHYNYVLYNEQRDEGEACFRALAANNVGTTVRTPLTQVRVIGAGDGDMCSGAKVMVLSPAYAGTSQRLQRFLYYQAYKLHSYECPQLAELCLKRKLANYTYHSYRSLGQDSNGVALTSGSSSSSSSGGSLLPTPLPFPYHCANLLCDAHVNLQQSPLYDTMFRIQVDSDKMRPLNNVCFKSLSRSKMARAAEDPSVQVNVPTLGISLLFDLL